MASTSGRAPALTPPTPRARRRPAASTRCAASRGGGGYRSRASSTSLLRDPYRVLGVPDDAAPEEIKLAYRRLTKATHPDVNPAKDAAETFRRVNAAYEILADPERRGRFDRGADFQPWTKASRPSGDHTQSGSRRVERPVAKQKRRRVHVRVVGARETRGGRPRRRGRGDETKGLRAAWAAKETILDAWCRAWFAALLVGVPAAAGIGWCTASRRSPYGEGYSTVDSQADKPRATRRRRARSQMMKVALVCLARYE